MKTKKIIFGLSCFAILTVCTLNVQSSLNMSNELGYVSLIDIITLNSASAEESGGSCNGGVCDKANGYSYNTLNFNGTFTCCGAVSTVRGDKSS